MSTRTSLAHAALTAMVVCVGMFVLPSAAFAGVGAAVTPGFPVSVTVGDQNVPATLTIQNPTIEDDNAGTSTVRTSR